MLQVSCMLLYLHSYFAVTAYAAIVVSQHAVYTVIC